MGGAKLVGTSSIGYKDGAVCIGTPRKSAIIKYNDYIVLCPNVMSDTWSVYWELKKDSSITISLLPINFDYIVLQPDPMNAARYDYYHYYSGENLEVYHKMVNVSLGTLPGNYDTIIYDKHSVTKRIMLQTMSQVDNPRYALQERLFTLSADSSMHHLVVRADQGASYNYSSDHSNNTREGNWIPDNIRENYNAMVGPCLGLYNILYYKY